MRKIEIPTTLVAVLSLSLLLFLFSFRKIYEEDFFWHKETGRLILEKGFSKIDEFSFTAENAPLINLSSLAQVLFFLFGDTGTQFLRSILVVAMFLLPLLFFPFKEAFWRLVACTLSLLGAVAASSRYLCRPALFSDFLFVLFILLILRLRGRKLLILAPLTALWVNLHNGVLLSPVLLLCAMVALLVSRFLKTETETEPCLRHLLLSLVAVLAATFVNPHFSDGALYPFLFFTKPTAYANVLEWTSPINELADFFSSKLLSYKLLFIALIATTISSYHRWRSFRITITALIIFLSLLAHRNISLFAVIAPTFIAANIQDTLYNISIPQILLRLLKYGLLLIILTVSAVISILCVTNSFWRSRHLYDISFGTGISKVTFPLNLPPFLQENPNLKHLFHNYELGGFLISKCARKPFLDGRLVHFPETVHNDYRNAITQPPRIESLAQKWNLDGVLLEHHRGRFDLLITYLYKSAQWELLYADCCVLLFKKRSLLHSPSTKNREVLETLVNRFKKGEYPASDYPEYDRESLIRLLSLLGESHLIESLDTLK
ncbi:MAG: hypothetical protein N2234_02015 [Planctomycetota bacterium]|nr:hypothetical protein [Planctomycetota bacterium]